MGRVCFMQHILYDSDDDDADDDDKEDDDE